MIYKIKIFDNIHDAELKAAWIKLEQDNDIFPQMYYEWIEPWVSLRFGSRKLHIITVRLKDQIIAIAPFCIERKFGIKVLTSIPIHYGDKYEFIFSSNSNVNELLKVVFTYIKKSKDYHAVKINQITENSSLFYFLKKSDFDEKLLTICPFSDFSNTSFDEYLMELNRKVRSDFRRRQKRLNEIGTLTFETHSSSEYYKENQDTFREIYEKRWGDIDKNLPGDVFYKCREESYVYCLDNNKALIVVLKLDDRIIGYRLGFISDSCYFDWKICFDKEYSKFGIGSIMTGRLIEKLKEDDINCINHGAGNYSYKRDWAPRKITVKNYMFLMKHNNMLSYIHNKYELKYKQILKDIITKIKKK